MLSTPAILCLLLLPPGHKHAHAKRMASKPVTVIELNFEERQNPAAALCDTIYYDPARKLQWDDFQAKPSPYGPSAAVSYTSFAYEGNSLLVHDTLRITLHLQVFFIKSASWVLFIFFSFSFSSVIWVSWNAPTIWSVFQKNPFEAFNAISYYSLSSPRHSFILIYYIVTSFLIF